MRRLELQEEKEAATHSRVLTMKTFDLRWLPDRETEQESMFRVVLFKILLEEGRGFIWEAAYPPGMEDFPAGREEEPIGEPIGIKEWIIPEPGDDSSVPYRDPVPVFGEGEVDHYCGLGYLTRRIAVLKDVPIDGSLEGKDHFQLLIANQEIRVEVSSEIVDGHVRLVFSFSDYDPCVRDPEVLKHFPGNSKRFVVKKDGVEYAVYSRPGTGSGVSGVLSGLKRLLKKLRRTRDATREEGGQEGEFGAE